MVGVDLHNQWTELHQELPRRASASSPAQGTFAHPRPRSRAGTSHAPPQQLKCFASRVSSRVGDVSNLQTTCNLRFKPGLNGDDSLHTGIVSLFDLVPSSHPFLLPFSDIERVHCDSIARAWLHVGALHIFNSQRPPKPKLQLHRQHG